MTIAADQSPAFATRRDSPTSRGPRGRRARRAPSGGEHPSRHSGLHNRVVLARIGPVTLVNFGLLAAVGGALATWVALARQEQAGMDPSGHAALLFGTVPLLAVLGSRAFSLALDWRAFLAAPVAETLKPGFAFQGGLVGATAGVVLVARYAGIDLLLLVDALALAFPLGHAVGRLACHTYGCCHGRPTRSPLAIRYTDPDAKAVRHAGLRGVPLHPTQLYSAVGNLVLFALLAAIACTEVRAGQIAAVYLIAGSTGRFLVEFLRGAPTARVLGLTPCQWTSAGLLACGMGLLHLASDNPLHARFADPAALLAGLRHAAFSIYPLWVFAVIFVCFGVQGRQVGSFVAPTSRLAIAPNGGALRIYIRASFLDRCGRGGTREVDPRGARTQRTQSGE